MAKKRPILIGVALVLIILFIHYFIGWFKPKIIQISHTERPMMSRSRGAVPMILFSFDGKAYRLSDIEVVPLAEWQTNRSVAPLWHLTANSRSRPLEFFAYGENIPGMNPAVPGARPEPLAANVIYRLFARAGSAKGQCDFQLGGGPVTRSPKR